jgi:hypothetical protein
VEKTIKTDICDLGRWQQMAAFGNILVAEGHPRGREWRLGWQQMAPDWQLIGNKWQRNGSRFGVSFGLVVPRVSDARDYDTQYIA